MSDPSKLHCWYRSLLIGLRQPKYKYLTVAMAVTLLIHLVYWLLFPYEIYFDRYTLVKTLWDGGWFKTVTYEYSRLCVENNVLPYMKQFSDYPFSSLEYPFLAGFLFYAVYLLSEGSFATYCTIFQFINMAFQVGISALIYLLAIRFYPMRRSFYLSIAYSLSHSILWFSMSRYDAIPAFFALLSLYLFLENRRFLSYVSLGIGVLLRIYPSLLVLAYLKHGFLNKRPKRYFIELMGIPSVVCLVVVAPLLVVNPSAIPWLLSHYATFGWNWESIYGPIDQFLRSIFPGLVYIYLHPEVMRVIFVVACLSILLLMVKTEWELVNGITFAILCWLQTQWFFSPQYVVWVAPLLLVVATSGAFLALYFVLQVVMTLEIPSPFYYLVPIPQFYYGLYIYSIRIFIFFVFMIVFLKRLEGQLIREKILKIKEWWHKE